MAGFNLLPVTLGNIVGAALFVAVRYWYVYLRGLLCELRGKDAGMPGLTLTAREANYLLDIEPTRQLKPEI